MISGVSYFHRLMALHSQDLFHVWFRLPFDDRADSLQIDFSSSFCMMFGCTYAAGCQEIRTSIDCIDPCAEFQWVKFSIESLIISMLDSDFGHIEDPLPEAGQNHCGLPPCGLLATSRRVAISAILRVAETNKQVKARSLQSVFPGFIPKRHFESNLELRRTYFVALSCRK